MGNCLKVVASTDDISLLRESTSSVLRDSSSQDLSSPSGIGITSSLPPPPYNVEPNLLAHQSSNVRVSSNTGDVLAVPPIRRLPASVSEEEQMKMAQRLGLIQHLPTGSYDGSSKKNRECVICMTEFAIGDTMRFLPCLHVYHTICIDDWLMRGSFTCPSCMEPVDAALLSTYQTD